MGLIDHPWIEANQVLHPQRDRGKRMGLHHRHRTEQIYLGQRLVEGDILIGEPVRHRHVYHLAQMEVYQWQVQ